MTAIEFLAVTMTIASQLLIAWSKRRTAIWGWFMSIAASAAWGVFALRVGSLSLLIQQLFFMGIGGLGLYKLSRAGK